MNAAEEGIKINLHQLLRAMIEKGASDMHITTGAPPLLRIDGSIVPLKLPALSPVETKQLCYSVLTEEQEQKMAWVRHKVARKHPITGRTALYAVSGSSFRIEGMPDDEAVDLLDELKRHATQEKYQLRLKYGVGDLVLWDNASLLHSATLTDPADPRTLWRITIKEEKTS